MRRIFLSAFVSFLFLSNVTAQDTVITTTTTTVYSKWERNNLNLRIGPEIGFPTGNFGKTNNFGIGASALLDVPVARRFSAIFYAGLKTFGAKDSYKRVTVYPLRAGINYKLSPDFYFAAQIGESTVHSDISKTSISQGLGIGYFNGSLDLGVRWDHEYAPSGFSSINIQAKYVIAFGFKKNNE